MEETKATQYNTCKPWQIYAWSTHDLVANAFLMVMNFVSYLAVGEYAILTATASLIITASRLLDGITDPLVAVLVDRMGGKFGRYRPMMVLGYIIMSIAILCMFFFCIPGNIVTFILLYVLYIVGYTFYNTAAGGGRAILTNDPVQRGKMGRWIAIFIQVFAVAFSFYGSAYVMRKHGGLKTSAFQEIAITMIVFAGLCVIASVIALKDKDKPEFYGGIVSEKVSLKDIFTTLKGNRNLRWVIVAASSDKLAQTCASNAGVRTMVWGIVAANYAFSGQLDLFCLIPMMLVMMYGTKLAMKMGNKVATIRFAAISIASAAVLVLLFTLGDPTQIGTNIPFTILFLLVYCVFTGSRGVGNAVVRPMIADVTDEELDRTGKFLPGIINATYTFVDKFISSLAATIVGLVLAAIGYSSSMPQIGDPVTGPVLAAAMFIWMGMPIIGWVCSIIAMKFYDLDPAKVEKIQASVAEKKKALAGK